MRPKPGEPSRSAASAAPAAENSCGVENMNASSGYPTALRKSFLPARGDEELLGESTLGREFLPLADAVRPKIRPANLMIKEPVIGDSFPGATVRS